MKKIINGKMYNTETAEKIATDESSCGRGDFNWYEETLYKTQKGNYFITGKGGPMSRWAQTVGQNSWSEGSGIETLSKQEALDWLERAGETEAIEKHFSAEIEEA